MFYEPLYDFDIEMSDGQRKVFERQTRKQAIALGVTAELLDQMDMQQALCERAFFPNMLLN